MGVCDEDRHQTVFKTAKVGEKSSSKEFDNNVILSN